MIKTVSMTYGINPAYTCAACSSQCFGLRNLLRHLPEFSTPTRKPPVVNYLTIPGAAGARSEHRQSRAYTTHTKTKRPARPEGAIRLARASTTLRPSNCLIKGLCS